LKMVERALAKNWKVELVAFQSNISSAYTKPAWASRWASSFSVTHLDEFAELLVVG